MVKKLNENLKVCYFCTKPEKDCIQTIVGWGPEFGFGEVLMGCNIRAQSYGRASTFSRICVAVKVSLNSSLLYQNSNYKHTCVTSYIFLLCNTTDLSKKKNSNITFIF